MMATKMVRPDESDGYALMLTGAEYETIIRALRTALGRARRVGASADEHEITMVLRDLNR